MATAATPSLCTTTRLFLLIRLMVPSIPSKNVNDSSRSANVVSKLVVIQKHDAVVLYGCLTHEIIHLPIRNVNDFLLFVRRSSPFHDISHGCKSLSRHLQLGQTLLCRSNENQIMNGRQQHTLPPSIFRFHHFPMHWHKTLNTHLVKQSFDFHFPMISDTHRKPMHQGFFSNYLIYSVLSGGGGGGGGVKERDTMQSCVVSFAFVLV